MHRISLLGDLFSVWFSHVFYQPISDSSNPMFLLGEKETRSTSRTLLLSTHLSPPAGRTLSCEDSSLHNGEGRTGAGGGDKMSNSLEEGKHVSPTSEAMYGKSGYTGQG